MTRRPPELRFFALFMRYWLPVLLYITVIITLSAQSNLQPPMRFRSADKVYHLLEYFGLGVLLARAMRVTLRTSQPLAVALLATCSGILMGTSDEYFQSFIPGRQCSALDLLVDTVGVALAQLLFLARARD
jgi:VanZ family protein